MPLHLSLTVAADLVNAVQTDAHAAALARVHALVPRAQAAGDGEVELLLRWALVAHALNLAPDRAEAAARALDDRATLLDVPFARALAEVALGKLAADAGDLVAAIDHLALAIVTMDDPRGSVSVRARALSGCGNLAMDLRLWDFSEDLLVRATALADLRDATLGTAPLLNRVLSLVGRAMHAIVEGGHPAPLLAEHEALLGVVGAAPLVEPFRSRARALSRAVRLLHGQPVTGPSPPHLDRVHSFGRDVTGILLAAEAVAALRLDEVELARDHARLVLARTHRPEPLARTLATWVLAEATAHSDDGACDAERDLRRALVAMLAESRATSVAAAAARIQAERLRAERDAYARDSLVDDLTGLGNRRALTDRRRRDRRPAALVLLDLDQFKAINDGAGHVAGDQVLRRFGALLRDIVRVEDFAARVGGDEFAVLLAETDLATALRRAEEICRQVAAVDWSSIVPGLAVTVSMGIGRGQDDDETYLLADRSLYAAKAAGGNVVRCAQLDPASA